MNIASFETDLTDAQWEFLEPMLPKRKRLGRPPTDRRQVLNAILYVLKGGIPWRLLPQNFPPWKTVYDVFRKWSLDHTWAALNDALRVCLRSASMTSKISDLRRLPRATFKCRAVRATKAGIFSGLPPQCRNLPKNEESTPSHYICRQRRFGRVGCDLQRFAGRLRGAFPTWSTCIRRSGDALGTTSSDSCRALGVLDTKLTAILATRPSTNSFGAWIAMVDKLMMTSAPRLLKGA